MSDQLSFAELREINVRRCVTAFKHSLEEWTPLEWSAAMCGEAGEAANEAKKLRRRDYRYPDQNRAAQPERTDEEAERAKQEMIHKYALELADVVTYADLCAARLNIDLAAAVREKFNIVSNRRGSDIKL
ncbi:MAG TPA: hypothetical protein VI565_06580 [Burkholderiales bacterium]|nr:hypothetical protein [Burkholderiales bacterium]